MAFDKGPVRHHRGSRTVRGESAQARLSRDLERAERNDHLLDHLTENETVRLATRQHPIVLWKPVLIAVAALALMLLAWADSELESPSGLFIVVFLVALGWLAYRWAWWSRHLFVATDKRILKSYGVFSTEFDSMRNTKVTDMKYRRTFVGELLGFGEITVESAGQDQALHDITYLPYPREHYQELSHIILGEKPRSGGRKPNRFRRSFEKLVGRRADPAPAYRIGFPDEADHDDSRGEAPADPHPRLVYSSREGRSPETSPIPTYPPGHFADSDLADSDDDGDEYRFEDPTRP